jgi:hypothetical protein
MINNNNIFYYFNDNTRFDSKLVALEHSIYRNQNFNIYYHDAVYDSLNWKIEPPGSLQSHYIHQAKRLRDEYDYLILCYSGGIDSTNILETFHYNNIKLDKIITVAAFSEDSFIGDDTNHNGEIYHNAFPYIKHLNLQNIFQVVDYAKEFNNLSKFSLLKNRDWIEKTGNWFSPHNWIWNDIHDYVVPKEFLNKKIAFIFGRDKPTLHIDESGNYYFSFIDSALNSYGYYRGRDNIDTVNFYWDPGYPLILIKQLHILKKFHEFSNEKNMSFNLFRKVQFLGNIDVHTLIYDLKMPLSFVGQKSQSTIISRRDTYLKNRTNSDVFDIYKSGVKDINARLGSTKVANIYSKKYFIS